MAGNPLIHVTGPRDRMSYPGVPVVNTTSRSPESWSKAFSPFYLGPIPLYGGHTAKRMENAWQYAKVYDQHLDAAGNPSEAYWTWAKTGWEKASADRYPMGKGAKPAYLWWDGQKLSYLAARQQVYFPLYRDSVRKTQAFTELQRMVAAGPVCLWDFDGYDHEAQGMPLADVFCNPARPMGHAFVLKAMLLFGPNVTLAEVLSNPSVPNAQETSPQGSLF